MIYSMKNNKFAKYARLTSVKLPLIKLTFALSILPALMIPAISANAAENHTVKASVAEGNDKIIKDLGLIPQPLNVTISAGKVSFTQSSSICFIDKKAKPAAEMLAQKLRPATGYKWNVSQTLSASKSLSNQACSLVFNLTANDTLGKEGYQLSIDSNVVITAPTSAGLFYGAQTFRQLLPTQIYANQKQIIDWQVPRVNITDQPRFSWRGMHLDVSRHFMPKADVLKFIDTLSTLKINTLHWHLTDDQGWRIEIKKYPKLTEVGAWREKTKIGHMRDKPHQYDGKPHGGFYTQTDIKEIVAYAQARHITIVPEIDMPGHMQAAIAAYPELGVTGEKIGPRTEWGISSYILNAEESTVQFTKDVIAEVIELFPSQFIHIGGDEAVKKQWQTSPRIQALIKERGLHDEHELQSWFIKHMDDFIVSKGRRMIGWDEITEGGLAPNAAIMWWRGKGKKAVMAAVSKGHDVVVASSSNLYFDKYQGPKESEPLAIGGKVYLNKVYNFDPTKGLTPAQQKHILGYQGQLWREYIPTTEHLEYMAFPRVSALAEGGWLSGKQRNYESYLSRLAKQERRWHAAGIHYRPQK